MLLMELANLQNFSEIGEKYAKVGIFYLFYQIEKIKAWRQIIFKILSDICVYARSLR